MHIFISSVAWMKGGNYFNSCMQPKFNGSIIPPYLSVCSFWVHWRKKRGEIFLLISEIFLASDFLVLDIFFDTFGREKGYVIFFSFFFRSTKGGKRERDTHKSAHVSLSNGFHCCWWWLLSLNIFIRSLSFSHKNLLRVV